MRGREGKGHVIIIQVISLPYLSLIMNKVRIGDAHDWFGLEWIGVNKWRFKLIYNT